MNCTVNLQLHIELEANRVSLSDKYADISSQKLLEALERNRGNWLDLNLDPCQTILKRVHNGRKIHTQWIVQDGLFSDAFYMEGHGSRLTNQIEMIPLDNPESRWNVQLEVPCHDFVTDPLQDLLTLVTFDREK
ncbi:hypothetical protein FRC12_008209 [Ceratobasidium sp. 428]|nr:hypothetical protein FRC12_008209 [Ceratobasidium sp. 428]